MAREILRRRIERLPFSGPVAAGAIDVSFEFFPPKTEEMERQLWTAVERLAPLKPRFVSVTYGAGGSTRERTHATVRRIRTETAIEPAAHLTCVAATRKEVDAVARAYWDAGIRHIVALRGDPPAGTTAYQPHPGGYPYAAELVEGLKRVADFEISVAAYPEVHPEAQSRDADLDNLKRKIDAGASRAITQFFFDTGVFLGFVERCRKAGISVPIVPGILPVTNYSRVVQFARACGAGLPDWLAGLFEGLDGDPGTRQLVAATVAAEQCRELFAEGVGEFHFYTLNRADLAYAICHILGLRPAAAPARCALRAQA
jgi:methylenetetrahydrofolate reductase (NADPH)